MEIRILYFKFSFLSAKCMVKRAVSMDDIKIIFYFYCFNIQLRKVLKMLSFEYNKQRFYNP